MGSEGEATSKVTEIGQPRSRNICRSGMIVPTHATSDASRETG